MMPSFDPQIALYAAQGAVNKLRHRFSLSKQDLDDVVQETVLQALKHCQRGFPSNRQQFYWYALAEVLKIKGQSKNGAKRRRSVIPSHCFPLDDSLASTIRLEETFFAKHHLDSLRSSLTRQENFLLSLKLTGFTHEEIAQHLKISVRA